MAEYDAPLNKDVDSKRTSAEWDAVNSRWVTNVEVIGTEAGSDPDLGETTDAAVTDPSLAGSVIALLKGLLTFLRVSAEGLGKAEDAAHVSGDTGLMPLAVRKDTAAVSSGTTGDYEPLQTDSLGRLRVLPGGVPGYPEGATAVTAGSGNVANASAVATIPAVASKMNYISGFEITGAGATAASVVQVTLAGVISGTQTFIIAVPAGVTAPLPPLIVAFNPSIPASAVNTPITLTVPALGAGNTNAAAVSHGFVV